MNDPFFGSRAPVRPIDILQFNSFSVQINLPPALKSRSYGGHEEEQSLPPYARTPGYRVDDLPELANEFGRSDNERANFVFGVRENQGLWFDFNQNRNHAHDVAVLISVQGLNPITGKQTDSFRLEQYPGQQPPQNYLASTGAPYGGFWLDGFMAADGVVRQWVFTADQCRGVAAQALQGGQVYAFGFAFYKSRQPKPTPMYRSATRGATLESFGGATRSLSAAPKSMEVAAGARIKQRVDRDPRDLSYWEQSPSAVMRLFYLEDSYLQSIVGRSQPPQQEGFLQGMPVGNP